MRSVIVALSLILISTPAWAGTFMDNFEDGDWEGWEVIAGDTWNTDVQERFSIVEGVLRIDAMGKPEDWYALSIMENWKDYSFSADMRIVECDPANPEGGGGIASRVGDVASYGSYILVGDTSSWEARSDRKGKDWRISWGVGLPDAVAPQIGEWHRAEIKVTGIKISFYVDGELEHDVPDVRHSSGGVRLFAQHAIVEFDNVVITGDDIPDVGPSGHAVEPEAGLTTAWGWIKR
jgi:hypothetical protein